MGREHFFIYYIQYYIYSIYKYDNVRLFLLKGMAFFYVRAPPFCISKRIRKGGTKHEKRLHKRFFLDIGR